MSKQTQMARLQLRWEAVSDDESGYRTWHCHYELVLPLGEFDIRREDENCNLVRDQLVIPIKGPTVRNAVGEPCRDDDGALYFDAPYRDGAHANWDAKLLGNLPVVVVAIDGTAIERPAPATGEAR